MEQLTVCPTHGDYRDPTGRQNVTQCPRCERAATESERAWRNAWSLFEHWERCGIPSRYRSRTLDNWTPASASQEAPARLLQAYASQIRPRVESGDGLTLLGPPGVGKTHILAALITAGHQAGIRGLYRPWPHLLAAHRLAMKAPADDPLRHAMDKATACPLLALDEIGHEGATDWERRQLFELVDYRYREGLPLLIASNATTKTLPELLGERLADRLQEVSAAVTIPGTSQRGQVRHGTEPALTPPPDSITVTAHRYGRTEAREITRSEYR